MTSYVIHYHNYDGGPESTKIEPASSTNTNITKVLPTPSQWRLYTSQHLSGESEIITLRKLVNFSHKTLCMCGMLLCSV